MLLTTRARATGGGEASAVGKQSWGCDNALEAFPASGLVLSGKEQRRSRFGMELNELQRSLTQLLENYQRCGVRRIQGLEGNALPTELLEAVRTLGRNFQPQPVVGAETKLASSEQPAPGDRSTASHNAARHAVEKPSNAPEPSRGGAAATDGSIGIAGNWALPVLEPSIRQSRLESLDSEVKACVLCPEIVRYRQQTVFGVGPVQPTVCFMGEAPGADEDRTGVPFVGKAGQLLSRIIAAMKLQRDEVYILNGLKCRPPQNRTPVPEEIDACRHFVETQLEILQPKYIVCLGAVAVRSLLQSNLSIGRLRGRFYDYKGAKVVVTYHPSYLLRNESAKRLVWDDMQMLMRELGLMD